MIAWMLLATLATQAPVTAHRPVTTDRPLAQQRFDTALTEMYAFDGSDAAIDFAGAALTDPHLAMAFWGKALAEGSDLNNGLTPERFDRAHADAQHAVALEAYASADERQLIDAVSLRYAGTFANANQDEATYETAMRAFVSQHPTDGGASMLLVEALLETHRMRWSDDDTPSSEIGKEMLGLVQGVLSHDPGDLMANHLCIHLYDTAPNRTFAVGCAQRLDAMTFGPGDEHLAHMPAHTWIEIGDGERALASSERAWALSPTEYAEHDAFVAFDAALVAGDRAAALKWASRLLQFGPYHEDAVIDARTADWQDIPSLKAPQNEFPLADGLAQLHLGNLDRASQDERALRRTHLSYDDTLLSARLDELRGNVQAAIGLLLPLAHSDQSAGEIPPLFPADQALAALYYRAGRYADAQQAFTAILASRPDDPRALFGMSQTLLALNQANDAARYAAEFHQYWAGGTLTMNDF